MSLTDELSDEVRGRAERLGRDWADEFRAAVVLERRRAAGGWPGTLSEARARVASNLVPWLTKNGAGGVSSLQREDAARLLYASARAAWMATRDPDDRDASGTEE